MLTKEERLNLLKFELSIYEQYLNALPKIEDVVKTWDKKCLNKKLKKDLQAALGKDFIVYMVETNTIGDLYTRIAVWNDVFPDVKNNCIRANNREITIQLGSVYKRPTGKEEVVYEPFAFESEKAELLDKIASYQTGIDEIAKMEEALSQLYNFAINFSCYDGRVRDVMGCNYALEYKGPSEFFDYTRSRSTAYLIHRTAK